MESLKGKVSKFLSLIPKEIRVILYLTVSALLATLAKDLELYKTDNEYAIVLASGVVNVVLVLATRIELLAKKLK